MTATMLTFAPQHDRPGKVDASRAFQPGARKFAATWQERGEVVVRATIDNHEPAVLMRRRVLFILSSHRELRCVAFFCHGLKSSLRLGFELQHVDALALALRGSLETDGKVVLYACDAARDLDRDETDDVQDGPGGEGGFADRLADSLRVLGWTGWVDAHTTDGHTTWNPFVRRFRGSTTGGEWIVAPRSPYWKRWRASLRDEKSTLRYRYPLALESSLLEELASQG